MNEETKQPLEEEAVPVENEAPAAEEAAPQKAEKPKKEKKSKEKTYSLTREQMEAAELAVKQLAAVTDQFTRLGAEY